MLQSFRPLFDTVLAHIFNSNLIYDIMKKNTYLTTKVKHIKDKFFIYFLFVVSQQEILNKHC